MTRARVAAIAAVLAVAVYVTALGNRFALDDGVIVQNNPAAHEVGAALRAFGSPYWPEQRAAGLWRPLVIVSFAVDWTVSGGNPAWLHLANVLWHALTTALVAAFLWPFLAASGALAGALVFAAHPVHVEAVANLVGRAELMAAAFVLGTILVARAVRERAAAGQPTWSREAALLGCLAMALLSKEHAVVTIALLGLDEWALRARTGGRLPARTWAAAAVVSVLWFLVRREAEGGASFAQVAPTFFHLDAVGRLATMGPVVFVLVRLLVWPFDLSADYHPRIVERLETLTAAGVAGWLLLVAMASLAFLLWRRSRAAALGLLVIGVAWLPTANLLFPTGIVIAERTLFLPSVGLALLAGAGFQALAEKTGVHRASVALAVVVGAFGIRSALRAPEWRDNRSLTVASLLSHPESFKVHESAARVFMLLGQAETALREYRLAVELYPLDHYLLTELGATERQLGRPGAALRWLRRAESLDSNYTLTQQLLAHALLEVDSLHPALRHARRAVALGPRSAGPARMLAASFIRLGMEDSALAVWPAFGRRGGRSFERLVYTATTLAALGRPDQARVTLDSAGVDVPSDSLAQVLMHEARQVVAGARPLQ